jgi:catechol 2,3-dioxygenase-like lactoylglutathione lyase family enzyme
MARTDGGSAARPATATRTNIHLGVADVQRATAFYEALLGGLPRVRDRVFAVFELAAPPLVLTIFTHPDPAALSRLCYALDVPRPEHVGAAAVALRRAGARLRLQDSGLEVNDPDGNTWKIRFVPRARGMAVVRMRGEEGAR